MAEQKILKLLLPGSDGINAVLDITKIDATTDDLLKRVQYLESGSRQFALKDYSQPENQGEMVTGVYYYVAFDADNTFLPPDEHGQPTGDIHHFDVYMKGDDGTVTFITRQYTDANLQNVAYTNKLSVFEAGVRKKTNASSWDTISDPTDLVSKGEVELHTAPIIQSVKNVTDVIGTNAENAALKNKENVFAEKNTFAKPIYSAVQDDDNASGSGIIGVASGSTIAAGAASKKYSNSLSINAEDDPSKKFASVDTNVAENVRSASLNVSDTTGTVNGSLGIKFDCLSTL